MTPTKPETPESWPCLCGHDDHHDDLGCMHCPCPTYRPVTRYVLPPAAVKYLPRQTPRGEAVEGPAPVDEH
jgi:hypothetical protein